MHMKRIDLVGNVSKVLYFVAKGNLDEAVK